MLLAARVYRMPERIWARLPWHRSARSSVARRRRASVPMKVRQVLVGLWRQDHGQDGPDRQRAGRAGVPGHNATGSRNRVLKCAVGNPEGQHGARGAAARRPAPRPGPGSGSGGKARRASTVLSCAERSGAAHRPAGFDAPQLAAFRLTPLRSATFDSFLSAAFSSLRLVMSRRTTPSRPSSSAQAIKVP